MSIFINQLNVLNDLEETNYIIVDTTTETFRTSLQALRSYLAGVKTINTVAPDEDGNVNLTPDNISDIASAKKFVTQTELDKISLLSSPVSDVALIAEIEAHDFATTPILSPAGAVKGEDRQEHYWESPAGIPNLAKCINVSGSKIWIKLV